MNLATLALRQIDKALVAHSKERALVRQLVLLRERIEAALEAKKTPVAELRELRGLLPPGKSAADTAKASADDEMSPAAADRLAKGKWFAGYAKVVRKLPATTSAKDLDPHAAFGPHVVFDGDVTVRGRFAPGHERGIVVIRGDLSAESVEVIDSVVVVTGKIHASRYVAYRAPAGEGLLVVAQKQTVAGLVRGIDTPLFLLADPARRGEIELFSAKRAIPPTSLAASLRIREDDQERLDAHAILSALRAGRRIAPRAVQRAASARRPAS